MLDDWNSVIWSDIPFLSIDTETTGFGGEHRIVQVAIASFYGDELRTKKWLVYPGRSIPYEVTKIHGISDETVKGAPMFADIRQEILVELRRAPWVAHQMRFDAGMLAKEIPPELWPDGMPTLCSLDYAKKVHPMTRARKGHKLADLANVFEIDYKPGELHDACYDAELLAHITHRMMRGAIVGQHMTKFSEEWLKPTGG